MLEVKSVSFRYERSAPWLLKGFSLNLRRGEVLGISGRSGCGKTTIAKLLAGYLKPVEGTVNADWVSVSEKCYNPVQLVFQHPEKAMNPRWTVSKILKEAKGSPLSSDLMESFCIDQAWMERYPHELSGGELQRIALVRVLNEKTRYIIADEITSMLDSVTQAMIWHMFLLYVKNNQTGLIVISHDESLLNNICHRRMILESASRV